MRLVRLCCQNCLFLEVAFEVGKALLPELFVLFRPVRYLLNPLGFELIDALSPLFPLSNESRFSQHTEVPRDGRPADSES